MSSGRVVIIGAGIAGAATAWWLTHHFGWQVVLVEAEDGPARHSSGKNAAIFRSAIAAAPTRELALETGEFLRNPPAGFCEYELLRTCGLLVVAGGQHEPPPAWSTDLEQRGVAQAIGLDDLRSIAPQFYPAGARAWWLEREGKIDISALIDAFLAGARRAGAELRYNAAVQEVLIDGGRVRGLRLASGEELASDAVLIAGGGWASRIGRAVGASLPLAPMRRHLVVTTPDARIESDWPVIWDDEAGIYFRPESAGLLCSACDETRVDPDRCELDLDVRMLALQKISKHLPSLADSSIAHIWSGIRTLSPDDVPILGEDPRRPGLFWAAGLGGHGMTTSYALGRLAAAAIADPIGSADELQAFSPMRSALHAQASV
ncbi:MAG: D-arginine dehydrogenase [Planctomycetota bacterium]|jgi:D-arginine dehydrogenase